MPTAMPPEPLTSRFGTRDGRTVGLGFESSKFGTKSTHSLSMSARSSIGELREARFGVAVGRRRVAVDRAVVALAVDERVAHREVLREADHARRRRSRRRAGGTCRARRRRWWRSCGTRRRDEAALVRGVQDAAVDGLEAVARVGDGAPDDDAHRVIEVARAHLVFEGHRHRGASRRWCRRSQAAGGIVRRGRTFAAAHRACVSLHSIARRVDEPPRRHRTPRSAPEVARVLLYRSVRLCDPTATRWSGRRSRTGVLTDHGRSKDHSRGRAVVWLVGSEDSRAGSLRPVG